MEMGPQLGPFHSLDVHCTSPSWEQPIKKEKYAIGNSTRRLGPLQGGPCLKITLKTPTNSKNGGFALIIKVYGQKTRKFIISPKITLH
jgi:hypothetical protein